MISSFLSIAAGALAGLLVLRFTEPRREVRGVWITRTLVALVLGILLWKLTPLWTRWETVFDNPFLLISMNGGLAAVLGGLFAFGAVVFLSLFQVKKTYVPTAAWRLLTPVATGLAMVALWTFSEPLLVPRPGQEPGAAVQMLVPDLAGKKHALADWRGQVTVVNFWATWCEPCLAELPEFQTFVQKPSDKVALVGVNLLGTERGGEAEVLRFALKNKLNWTQLTDPAGDLQKAFAVTVIPTTVVLDAQGRVVDRREGAVDLFWLKSLEGRFGAP